MLNQRLSPTEVRIPWFLKSSLGRRSDSLLTDATLLCGRFNTWNQIKYHTAQHPFLVLIVLFAVLVVALAIYRWLRSNAKRKQAS